MTDLKMGRSGAEIKSAYEGEADTNAFTDAEKSKLAGVESSATADQSDAEVETAYNNQVGQVSAGEKTAGTETAIRRFAPKDVADMAGTHGGGSASFPRGHLYGLTISNNGDDPTNDIDIAAGEGRSDDNDADIALASLITKRLDAAWAVGDGNGGLDTGSIADDTYHVHAIRRSDTGVVDGLFSTSPDSPVLPTNYDSFRRVASIVRLSGAILPFDQDGDFFTFTSSVLDLSTSSARSAALLSLTLPTDIRVRPLLKIMLYQNAAGSSKVKFTDGDLSVGDEETGLSARVAGEQNRIYLVGPYRTNTSGQIIHALTIDSGSIHGHDVATAGWIDARGRL